MANLANFIKTTKILVYQIFTPYELGRGRVENTWYRDLEELEKRYSGLRQGLKAKPTIKLPNPEGPLKVDIRPSTIRAVNEKLLPTIESGLKNFCNRHSPNFFSPKRDLGKIAKISRYTVYSETGVNKRTTLKTIIYSIIYIYIYIYI